MTLAGIVSGFCLLVGSIFCLIGGIGLLRFPGFYSRLHATGLTDTLGATMIFVGLMFIEGPTLVSAKLVIILLLILITGPTAAHALVKAAFAHGLKLDLEPEDLERDPAD